MNEDAVSNSSCLIALERIGRLDLLSKSFTSIMIPPAVENEFGGKKEWLIVRPVQNSALVKSLKTQVDDGEAEAIALAMEISGVSIILDDKKARRIAAQLGLKVIGTVGLLLRAKKKGVVAEIKPILNDLQEVNFRVDDILFKALRLAKEEYIN